MGSNCGANVQDVSLMVQNKQRHQAEARKNEAAVTMRRERSQHAGEYVHEASDFRRGETRYR